MDKTSDFYKFVVGENKIRLMSVPVKVKQVWKEDHFEFVGDDVQVAPKYWAWAIIRETSEMKIVKLPYSVVKLLQQLMAQEEYSFENYPMPYDLTITATGEDKERRYTVTAARKNTDITAEETEEISRKTKIEDILQKMKDKANAGKETSVKAEKDFAGLDYPPFEESVF
jgi:hypothetical protein